MKRASAQCLAVIVLVTVSLPTAWGQAQFNFEANNGTITLTKYIGPGGDVTIPGDIDGLPVTSIGHEACFDCTGVTSITIPDSVTSIGDWAFTWCSSLTGVMRVVAPHIPGGDTDNRRAAQIVNRLVVSFFNKHLLGQDDHLLDDPGTAIPELVTALGK